MEDNFPHLTDEEAKKVWTKAFNAIRRKEKQKRQRKLIAFGTIAAMVIISIGIMTYRNLFLPDVYQANGNTLAITLKDGSYITLSKGAKLTVERSFPAETRDVYLEGDAVFKIAKSKKHPFIVHGAAYQTKVLGTVFKVTQKGNAFVVDLFEGKVEVVKTEKPKEVFVLQPKERFSNMGSLQVATVLPNQEEMETTKTNSNLVFSDLTLSEGIRILETMYEVKINYPAGLARTTISITKKKPTLENLLQVIAFQLNLNTKKINEKTFELEE